MAILQGMDEILIEERRYVSSKRAAKVTGYAKDYIGQLCREGRVPARLVGRSWYVLESAIHDHRFGTPDQKFETATQGKQTLTGNWESPRYEASKADTLPSVNRLRDIEAPVSAAQETPQPLEDSWKAWFDRVTDIDIAPVSDDALGSREIEEERVELEQESEQEAAEEVPIPIRTVYDLPPENLLPRHVPRLEEKEEVVEEVEITIVEPKEEVRLRKAPRKGVVRTIQFVGVTTAMLAAALAVIGSGYFDKYILTSSQVGILAGVATYNR